MCNHPTAKRALLGSLVAAISWPAMTSAEQLPLVQYPAGSASRQPAPNVILTLDDSGSMGSSATAGVGTGMHALKTALQEVFSASSQNIPDGSIRLAWNAMNKCRTIPASDNGCNNNNTMRVLDATHRTKFLNWVGLPGASAPGNGQKLTGAAATGGTNGTPTHRAYIAAGDYIKSASPTDRDGPWANIPGTTLDPVLSCRRTYSVLMTDGGWNWTFAAYGGNVARGGVMTADGVVNGNASNVTFTLPDGTVYDKDSQNSRVYRDTFTSRLLNGTAYEYVTSLANLAFYYWATDLAPALDNNISPLIKQSGPQTFGQAPNAVTLPQYWNPKNNPATWQGITTYTIGFSDASGWTTSNNSASYYYKFPKWDTASNDTYGGDFEKLVTGAEQKAWPDPVRGTTVLSSSSSTSSNNEQARQTELWHMALNGRGRFVPSGSSSDDLIRAFKEIFGEIAADTSTPITSFASSSSSISRSDTTQYTTGYDAATWKGYVLANTVAQGSAAATPDKTWGTKSATPPNLTTADKLDALDASGVASRLILTWRDLSVGGGGTSFEWAADQTYLSTAQKALLKVEGTGTVTDTVAQQRLSFIRGDRSLEGSTFRTRGSRQGDIVNSSLWYVGAPSSGYGFEQYLSFAKKHKSRLPMVYVGGNDGMLHGFSGTDGTEKIAYVPKGVIQNLPELTRTSYQHRYYVDGSPFSGDVNVGDATTPDWRTLLVGTLGAGGRGYFVLDVTSPGSTATGASAVASNFHKANAASLVVMDKTYHPSVPSDATAEQADLGHMMGRPVLDDGNSEKTTQIVRMNNGRWAVVMGNGYNSANERPVLLIQYLSGADRALHRIVAASTGANAMSNGLSAPRLVDLDGNGTADVIYAGDLRGNVWKFDVASASQNEWRVAFDGLPLYTAAHVDGNVTTQQSITAPPLVRANERGVKGYMVAFGTGRNITEGDRTDRAVQTIYSVLDSTVYKKSGSRVVIETSPPPTPVGSGVTQLVKQEVIDTAITGAGDSAGRTFWALSQEEVPFKGDNAKKGWYLNLPAAGERVLDQMSFYDATNVIELISEVPASGGSTAGETCAPISTRVSKYRTLLNIMDGKALSQQVMDTNGDGVYSKIADQNVSRMTASSSESRFKADNKQVRVGAEGSADRLATYEFPLRPNWRQLQ